MAVPRRDQLAGDAHEGRSGGDREQLDLELLRRAGDAARYREPRLEVLPHLDVFQHHLRAGACLFSFASFASSRPPLLPVHPQLIQPPQLIWLVYPETSNRHLEDIDRLYRENQGMVFVFRNKDATSMQRPTHYVDVEKERMQYVDSTKKKDKLADEASIEHDEAPAALNAA